MNNQHHAIFFFYNFSEEIKNNKHLNLRVLEHNCNANRQGVPHYSIVIGLQMIISRPKSHPCCSCIK